LKWPLCWAFHPARRFFHVRCMQSTYSSTPGHPCSALLPKRFSMSSSSGTLKYYKDLNQGRCVSSNGLQDCVFPDADIVVNNIGRTHIRMYSNSCDTLHQWAHTDIPDNVLLLNLKKIIMLLHSFCNSDEEILLHLIWPEKILLRIGCVGLDVIFS
jgi:hypothetical protein